MTVRTAEELEGLKSAYREQTYDPYAAEQRQQGFEPQDFDEAFAAHLEALDKEAPAPTADTAPAGTTAAKPAKKAASKKTDAAKPAKAAAKPKAEPKPKAAAAPKEPKVAKPKKFRPTSADRASIMTTAGKITKGDTPRMKLANGDPYVNFLKGVDTDANGNAEVLLDVFTAKDARAEKPTAMGRLKVTVAKGALKSVTKTA